MYLPYICNLLKKLKNIKMKKTLLFAFVILFTTATFAQSNLINIPNENITKGYSTMLNNPSFIPSVSAVTPTTVWYDDCSDISTWTVTNSSTLGVEWAISYDPAEIPSADVSPIASTTAANGYMFISSDADGGATDNDGTTISTEFTNATPIDLTNYPNVQLTFQHCFRWWHDTRVVRISPDNGVTWIELDEISNDQTYSYPNQSSNNPHMSTYDISSVAGGYSEVLVQFYYNDNDWWAWFWGVDDIAISELPDNMITSTDEVMGGWWIGYQGAAGGLGQDYTSNPISQATANPYAFEGVLRNAGIGTQEATLHVDVTQDATSSSVFSSTSNAITLGQGEQDTVAVNNTFTPSTGGLYSVDMWAVADSAGLGNVITYTDTTTKMTMVTDYVYGKDNGTNDGGYWRLNRVAPMPGGFEVSSNYDIYADAMLYSVDVHISDWSIPGAEVYVALYEEDLSSNTAPPILLDVSDPYAITSSDLGAWINIPFLSGQQLTAATKQYRIAIGANIHPTDSVGVDVSSSANGSYSADGLFDKDGLLSDPPGTVSWYTISDIPMLRMNFNPLTLSAVSNVKQTIFNVYPNPTNGVFSIELVANQEYDLVIYNVLGQEVYETTTNGMSNIIDLSSFDKGIYTIELKDKDLTYTEKVIVE